MAIIDLIKQINEVVDSPPSPNAISDEERVALLASLDKLRAVVETPVDFTTRVIFGVNILFLNVWVCRNSANHMTLGT